MLFQSLQLQLETATHIEEERKVGTNRLFPFLATSFGGLLQRYNHALLLCPQTYKCHVTLDSVLVVVVIVRVLCCIAYMQISTYICSDIHIDIVIHQELGGVREVSDKHHTTPVEERVVFCLLRLPPIYSIGVIDTRLHICYHDWYHLWHKSIQTYSEASAAILVYLSPEKATKGGPSWNGRCGNQRLLLKFELHRGALEGCFRYMRRTSKREREEKRKFSVSHCRFSISVFLHFSFIFPFAFPPPLRVCRIWHFRIFRYLRPFWAFSHLPFFFFLAKCQFERPMAKLFFRIFNFE